MHTHDNHTQRLAAALAPVAAAGLNPHALAHAVTTQRAAAHSLDTLWAYYRNHLTPKAPTRAGKPYALAQQKGLPLRLTDPRAAGSTSDDRAAGREIVIENDIAWRIGAMIDFLFGKPVRLVSLAPEDRLAARINRLLEATFEASGGLAMLQEAALLAHVYGTVDLLVTTTDDLTTDPLAAAEALRVTPVAPTRCAPITSQDDWRTLDGYALIANRPAESGERRTLIEAHSPTHRCTILLVERGGDALANVLAVTPNRLSPGRIPVAHVQNAPQPFTWHGVGEVEPLIPLQDELNTRLSDRANRVTMQSFKMFLAKGIDGFERAAVGPGVLLSTDNPEASVTTFGGDAASPSEDRHIDELREAMDKVSGVPPLATGVVRAKVGNLSSENALRLTLQGLFARTARKRIAYGRAVTQTCHTLLTALHHAGALSTTPAQRAIRVEWPDPLTLDQAELLRSAKDKRALGLTTDQVLGELGYATQDAGIE